MIQEKGAAMSDLVYDHLKDMILSRQLVPGAKIPEAKLAAQFGFSRTPVREAVKHLASDGIVTLYPNRYAEVSVFPQSWLQEVGIVRVALDIVAAHLAILHGSNYDYLTMTEYHEECLRAARRGDVARRIKMNCAFHLELSRIGRNAELYDIQKRLYLKMEYVQACHYGNVYSEEEQYSQHQAIIDALYARDEEALIHLLSIHDSNFHRLNQVPSTVENISAFLLNQTSL